MSAATQGSVGPPHSITRNTVLSFVQLTGAAFTAIIVIVLTRRLGTHGYGVFALALGIVSLVLLPSDFHLDLGSPVRGRASRPARAHPDGDGRRLPSQVLDLADRLRRPAALAGPIASAYGIPAAAWPIRVMSLALFGNSVYLMAVVFTAIGRIDFQLRVAFAESAIELIASLALVLAGAGATGAAFGRAIGYLAGGTVTVVLLVRALGPGILPTRATFGHDARPHRRVSRGSCWSSTVPTPRSRRSTS